MDTRTRDWLNPGAAVPLMVVVLLSGCASRGAPAFPAPMTTVEVGRAPAPPAAVTLPELSVSQLSDAPGGERRIEHLDLVRQDLPTVLLRLAESFGLEHEIDPSVRGEVTLRRTNLTLEEALDQIVLPQGFQYQLTGGVLRVVPVQLRTRLFELDYVSISRTGAGSTVAQTSLAGTPGMNSGGQFGGLGGGGVGGGVGGGAFGGGANLLSGTSGGGRCHQQRNGRGLLGRHPDRARGVHLRDPGR